MVMMAALAAGAAEKFVIALPNGYEMSRARSGAAVISKRRGKVVVPGPIKSYTVVREVVVGQLDVPEPKDQESSDAAGTAPPAPDAAATATPAPAAGSPTAAPAEGAGSQPSGGAAGGAPAGAAQGGGMRPPGAAAGGGRPGAGGAPGGGKPAPAADKPPANPVFTRPPPSPNGRYFVLDTKSGEVGKDLSLTQWEERLKTFDITSAPQLAAPILPK
jgi:hypothetical protein